MKANAAAFIKKSFNVNFFWLIILPLFIRRSLLLEHKHKSACIFMSVFFQDLKHPAAIPARFAWYPDLDL